MVCHHLLLFWPHNAVFFLFSCNNYLHRFKKIFLIHMFPAMFHCIDSSFINHIGKVRPHCTGCGKRYGIKIHAVIHEHILSMYFQSLHTSLEVRLIYYNPSVKPPRTQQCLVQYFRAVGSCQNQQSLRGIKTIHLRQQLI